MRQINEIHNFFKKSQKREGKLKLDKNDRAVIDVGAQNYGDIFSYYSLETLNILDPECEEFLETRADAVPINTDLTFRFHIKDANEKKRKEIEHAVRENYLRKSDIIIKQLKNKSLFSLTMLLIGAGMFAMYYLSIIFSLHLSIQLLTDIATWVFLWEAVYSFFLERQQLKVDRLKKYRMIFAKIEVVEYNNYYANISEEERKNLKVQRAKQKMQILKEILKQKNKKS